MRIVSTSAERFRNSTQSSLPGLDHSLSNFSRQRSARTKRRLRQRQGWHVLARRHAARARQGQRPAQGRQRPEHRSSSTSTGTRPPGLSSNGPTSRDPERTVIRSKPAFLSGGQRADRAIIGSIRRAFRLFPAEAYRITRRSTKNGAPRSFRCS